MSKNAYRAGRGGGLAIGGHSFQCSFLGDERAFRGNLIIIIFAKDGQIKKRQTRNKYSMRI